jgi:type II secretory pathway pseudopilin PulG
LLELVVVLVILASLAALVVGLADGHRERAESTSLAATQKAVADALLGHAAGPGLWPDLKYVPGYDPTTTRLHDLLVTSSRLGDGQSYDIQANRGWRGPYVRSSGTVLNQEPTRLGRFPSPEDTRFSGDLTFADRGFFPGGSEAYGSPGELAIADPWGNPLVLQIPPPGEFIPPADAPSRLRYARIVSAGPDGNLTTPNDRLAGRLSDGTAPARGDDVVYFLSRADVHEP